MSHFAPKHLWNFPPIFYSSIWEKSLNGYFKAALPLHSQNYWHFPLSPIRGILKRIIPRTLKVSLPCVVWYHYSLQVTWNDFEKHRKKSKLYNLRLMPKLNWALAKPWELPIPCISNLPAKLPHILQNCCKISTKKGGLIGGPISLKPSLVMEGLRWSSIHNSDFKY